MELFIKDKSIYDINDSEFLLTIKDFKLEEEKITLTLKGKESLIATKYLKNEEEYNYYKNNLKYGLKISINGTLTVPNNNTIPNCFNYKKYLNNRGIYYILNIDKITITDEKINFLDKIKNIINKRILKIDEKGYIKAFILGDKSNIEETIYNKYQEIGITHLFALSGMHVSLITTIILKITKKLKTKYIIANIFLFIYGYIVNFPSSIKRCIIFFLLNTINKILKLNISSFKLLLITIYILVIYNYKIIYDIGFIYSIITVGGILLYQDIIKDNSKIKTSLKLSIIAFLFSLPISLSNFYSINILSIIYNLFFIPLISIIIYPLSLLTFILTPLTNIFNILIHIIENIVSNLSEIKILTLYLKLNIIEIIIYYIILIISLNKRNIKIFCLIPLIIAIHLITPLIDSKAYIYFFDVGQGDSCLIISPNRKDIILIDTGGIVSYSNNEYNVTDNIITFLKSKSIKIINLLILSHGDADHSKEVENLLTYANIEKVNINKGEIKYYESIAIKEIPNKEYTPKNLNIKYLNYKDYNDENANSLLTFITIYNKKIISFGDATIEAEEDIISKYNLKNIDIAKLSHHGSNTSSSYKYLKTINPKYAIISSGRNNRFNHPHKEVLDNLNKLNIQYLNTQDSGTIEFIISENNITYNEYKT